jgi:N-acetylglutamate synthase-like GNAT family acetyltransferase
MHISNNISHEQIPSLVHKIETLINKDSILTERTNSELRDCIKNSNLYIMRSNTKLVGFVGKKHVYRNWYELISLYVVPKYRKKGYGKSLLHKSHSDSHHNYIAATYDSHVLKMLQNQNFILTPISKLPVNVAFSYTLSRNISSVSNYLFNKKTNILVKRKNVC